MKKKILFTGGSGLLAINWGLHIEKDFEVFLGLHKRKINIPEVKTVYIDIESINGFCTALETIQPDFVIHCAGLANVEDCESNPDLAYKVNVLFSENVAIACKKFHIQLVYISTDHLFSGLLPMVSEEEPTCTLNQYGRTKLQGERMVLTIDTQSLIIRTNFYGWGTRYRNSFSDFIINNLRKDLQVNLFEDFYYTPILIEELSQTVMELIAKNAKGVFNVVGDERISKYEFGKRLANTFNLNANLIQADKFSNRKDLVQRPLDLSLSNKKVSVFLNKKVGNINDNILRLFNQEQNGVVQKMHQI